MYVFFTYICYVIITVFIFLSIKKNYLLKKSVHAHLPHLVDIVNSSFSDIFLKAFRARNWD